MLRIFPDMYVLQHAYPAAYAVEFLPVQTMPLTWCLRQVFFRPCALLATVSLVLHVPHFVQALQRASDRAVGLELQHMRERKHVFKKARPVGGSSKKEQGGKAGSSKESQGQGSKQQKKTKLSFAEDEEEEEEQ